MIATAPVLYAGAFLVGSLLHSQFPMRIVSPGVASWATMGLLFFGAVLAVWSRRVLERAHTNVHPSLPTTTLVVTGPFRFSRNPMYVARTVLYLGLAFWVNALCVLVALVPLLAIIHCGVVRREERYLATKFGDAYRQYQSTVRRWL